MMGVATLGCWAEVTENWDSGSGTLTITYHNGDDFNAVNNSLGSHSGQVKKLVLVGDFTNDQFSQIGDNIGNAAHSSDGIILDLTDCTSLFCKVAVQNNDWIRSSYEYYYTDAMASQNVTKTTKFVEEDGTIYEGTHETEEVDGVTKYYYTAAFEGDEKYNGTYETEEVDGETVYYYEEWLIDGSVPAINTNEYNWLNQVKNGETPSSAVNGAWVDDNTYTFNEYWSGGPLHTITKTRHNIELRKVYLTEKEVWYYEQNGNTIYVDESEVTLTDPDDENCTTGTIQVHASASEFKLGNFKSKLAGIYFPNTENFTAIPVELCNNLTNLKEVKFGDYTEIIGNLAFKGCNKLNNVTFPQTVKVIGLDAFHGCQSFTVVDLRIRDLVKVDAAAFNMDDVAKNKLSTVYLPLPEADGKNNTLKFFANQVFASSHIKKLDFGYFYGIDHFAYDGEAHFGETVPSGISNTNRTFTWLVDLEEIILPPNLRHVGDECFFNCYALEEAIFTGEAVYDDDCNLTNPLTIGEKAFKIDVAEGSSYSNLKSVTFSDNVTTIGEQAFMDAQLTEVVFPASIEEIGKQAFACSDPGTIQKVVFEEIDHEKYGECNHAATVIKTEAFNHQTVITDVYINTVTDITCNNWAFDHNVTFSQGNPERAGATLHFPEGHEAHYVNLDHPLTNEIASNPGDFQKWLTEHYANAQDHDSGYGWYEFVNSGSTKIDPDDPEPSYDPDELPLLLRTYSDPQYARIVPDGLRAYIVNNVEKKTNGTYELTLKRLLVIPAQTGVILFGQPNSKNVEGRYVVSMTATTFKEGHGQPLRRDYWDMLSANDQSFKNYLMPIIENAEIRTVEEGGNQTFKTTNLLTVYPYEPYKSKNVEWRNFALNRMSETENLHKKFEFDASLENYAGFFRIKPGTYKSGYAYLHLSADEFDAAEGAECIVKVDGDYYKEYNTSGIFYDPRETHGWWKAPNTWDNMISGWGTRNEKFNTPGAIQFLGEIEDTDGIVKLVIPENKMGEVFSISGMKVTNPSKGIYIQNGKKVIIK